MYNFFAIVVFFFSLTATEGSYDIDIALYPHIENTTQPKYSTVGFSNNSWNALVYTFIPSFDNIPSYSSSFFYYIDKISIPIYILCPHYITLQAFLFHWNFSLNTTDWSISSNPVNISSHNNSIHNFTFSREDYEPISQYGLKIGDTYSLSIEMLESRYNCEDSNIFYLVSKTTQRINGESFNYSVPHKFTNMYYQTSDYYGPWNNYDEFISHYTLEYPMVTINLGSYLMPTTIPTNAPTISPSKFPIPIPTPTPTPIPTPLSTTPLSTTPLSTTPLSTTPLSTTPLSTTPLSTTSLPTSMPTKLTTEMARRNSHLNVIWWSSKSSSSSSSASSSSWASGTSASSSSSSWASSSSSQSESNDDSPIVVHRYQNN